MQVNFAGNKVDKKLVKQFSTLDFTDTAQNVVLIGGHSTGETHLATAIGVNVRNKPVWSIGGQVPLYSTTPFHWVQ